MLDLRNAARALIPTLLLSLAACAASVRPAGYIIRPMTGDNLYTLYNEQGFVLASLADGTNPQNFWDRFTDELARQTAGETTASLQAGSRVLRVAITVNHVPMTYHYAVFSVRSAHGTDIRLQPLTAWSQRMGHPDQTEPMRAADSAPELAPIEMQLKTAAAAAAL